MRKGVSKPDADNDFVIKFARYANLARISDLQIDLPTTQICVRILNLQVALRMMQIVGRY